LHEPFECRGRTTLGGILLQASCAGLQTGQSAWTETDSGSDLNGGSGSAQVIIELRVIGQATILKLNVARDNYLRIRSGSSGGGIRSYVSGVGPLRDVDRDVGGLIGFHRLDSCLLHQSRNRVSGCAQSVIGNCEADIGNN
jgi:hypothetical protein